MNEFDKIFSQYEEIKSKFNGSFTIVAYKLSQENLIQKINHQIGLINLMSDRYKKNFLLNRIFTLRDYVNSQYIEKTYQISNVFLVHDEIINIEINKLWSSNIDEFDINNFIFKYTEYFDINFLKDLFLNTTYTDTILVSQNKFTHSRYTPSKRKYVDEGNSNNIELQKYINDFIGSLTKSDSDTLMPKLLIYGPGQIIKNFTFNDDRVIIVPKSLREEEITMQINVRLNDMKSKELENWLNNIIHPEHGKKLVFGKDIMKAMNDKLIKTVYCTPEMIKKIKNKVPIELQLFEMIEINSYGDDVGKVLKDNYSGIIGILYY